MTIPTEETLEQKLAKLQKQVEDSETARRALETAKLKSDAELERVRKQQSKPPVQPVATAPTAAQGAEALRNYANEQAREAARLRTAIEFGLTEEDLLGDYSTPTELRLAAQVKSMEKKLVSASEQSTQILTAIQALQAIQTAPPPPEDNRVDTGGPTSGRRQRSATRAAELREQAKSKGSTKEGRWLLLRSIHNDPQKIIQAVDSED